MASKTDFDRDSCISIIERQQSDNDEWIRHQVIDNDRVDILAAEVLGLPPRPFHVAMMRFQLANQKSLQLAFRGAGKCLAPGTLVMMADGSTKKVEDIIVGDQVMGPDSAPRNVLALGSGRGQIYRIVPAKGESWICNDEHVLTLVGRGHQIIDKPIKEVIEQGKRYGREGTAEMPWKLWRPAIEFPERVPFLDPYFFGLWVGDGTTGEASVTNVDLEVEEWLAGYASRIGGKLSTVMTSTAFRHSITFDWCRNPVRRYLRSLGRKKIPEIYLRNSRENRLRFLAGLLDSDGHLGHHKTFEIVQKDRGIAEDIVYLARSLGFGAYLAEKVHSIKSTGVSDTYYRVNISGELSDIPCRIERKKYDSRLINKDPTVVGFRIEDAGEGDYFGFTLDGDSRFLLGDFTVTHNSTMLITCYLLQRILKDPDLRCCIVSKTQEAAVGQLSEIKKHIEDNQIFRRIFGDLVGPKWHEASIIVDGRKRIRKEPTILAIGVGGQVTGKHFDILIADDMVDLDNSRTEHGRNRNWKWYNTSLMPTLEAHSRLHVIGTRYHPDDLYGHVQVGELRNCYQIVPALDEQGRTPWPEKYSCQYFVDIRTDRGFLEFECHSDDTEFLTEDGWKLFDDVSCEDRLATFNTEYEILEYQRFTDRHQKHFDGQMLHIKNRSVDALVTPNHRFWVHYPGSSQYPFWRFVDACDLVDVCDGRFEIPQVLCAIGGGIDHISGSVSIDKGSVKPYHYRGMVSCFTVPNGTLITRRNGRALISGNSQYQCNADTMKGEIFKYDWMEMIDPSEVPDDVRGHGGIDLAIKKEEGADEFAIVSIGYEPRTDTVYVLSIYSAHLRFTEQTTKILSWWRSGLDGWFEPPTSPESQVVSFAIETNAYQDSQAQVLEESDPTIRMMPIHTLKDKVTRAHKLSPRFERGRVKIVRGPFVNKLIDQLVLFPNYPLDDLFDALDLAITVAAHKGNKKGRRGRRRAVGLL